MKKTKSMFDEPCRNCGVKFGEDDRSFSFEPNHKQPICFNCELERMPKKALINALSVLARK